MLTIIHSRDSDYINLSSTCTGVCTSWSKSWQRDYGSACVHTRSIKNSQTAQVRDPFLSPNDEKKPGQTLQGNTPYWPSLAVISHSRMTGDAQTLSKACKNFPWVSCCFPVDGTDQEPEYTTFLVIAKDSTLKTDIRVKQHHILLDEMSILMASLQKKEVLKLD